MGSDIGEMLSIAVGVPASRPTDAIRLSQQREEQKGQRIGRLGPLRPLQARNESFHPIMR